MNGRWLLPFLLAAIGSSPQDRKPNVIFILADDLGYGELGCYGQKKIKTPSLDRLASEGMRFTQFYSGSPVCAPSRGVLMTGKHSGHAFIRTNHEIKPEGQLPIPAGAVTIAELLKARGYATGAMGKWGLGFIGTDGDPNKQGFDYFYGYNCQRHAHNHYPPYVWRNEQKIPLDGNDGGATGKVFTQDLFEAEALKFVEANKEKPFFLYLPFTIPHVAMQVPEDSLAEYTGQWEDPPYDGKKGYQPHPKPRAAHAAMITRMDRSVGRILDLVARLNLDKDTVVFFSSDNGSIDSTGGHDLPFFAANGLLRGQKGQLYEGGIRVPFIARWTGKIKPGTTSDRIGGFQDVLPTLCQITGAAAPADIDGISFLPTLTGAGEQKKHEFLYWEFPSYGGQQAVRMGDWKAIRTDLLKKPDAPIQLYNLADDIAEKNDLASKHPELVQKIARLMSESRVPSKEFPFKALDR